MTGLRRYRNRRDASEPEIIEAFEDMQCLVYRMDKPVDLLVMLPPYVIGRRQVCLVECKTGKGKLTIEQIDFASRWPVYVIRSADEAIAMVQGMRAAA